MSSMEENYLSYKLELGFEVLNRIIQRKLMIT